MRSKHFYGRRLPTDEALLLLCEFFLQLREDIARFIVERLRRYLHGGHVCPLRDVSFEGIQKRVRDD